MNDGHGERVFYHAHHDAALDAHDGRPCAMSDVLDDAPDDVVDVVLDDALLYYAIVSLVLFFMMLYRIVSSMMLFMMNFLMCHLC